MTSPKELSDRDKAILTFEAKHIRMAGGKEELIRSTFGLRASRYFQIVNRLIDTPAALVYDPQLVKRLLAARERRTVARARREFDVVR